MLLIPLLLAALLAADPPPDQTSASQDRPLDRPVALDKIREGLEDNSLPRLRGLDETPNFSVAIQDSAHAFTLDELIQSLAPGFKAGPVPAGGVYAYELNRVTNNSVSHPLTQPYAAFNEPELLTILAESLAGSYLAGRAARAMSSEERAGAEARASAEVHRAIAEYCAGQPDAGRGIAICLTPAR